MQTASSRFEFRSPISFPMTVTATLNFLSTCLYNSYSFFGFIYKYICSIFCVLFFGLLSSSLLLVVTQCFGCCILWPCSGFPYLSGYGNNLIWEIIFKVWLLGKQGIQEIWRSYSNNDVIVFHVYQSEKHYKKFHKKRHEMNLKRKIQWHQLFLIFYF